MLDFLKFKQSAGDLVAYYHERVDLIERLKREAEDTRNAPMPRADAIRAAHQSIDIQASTYIGYLQLGLASLITAGHQPTTPVLPLLGQMSGGSADSLMVKPEAIACFFNKQLKEALTTAINAMEWPGEEGLPLAERERAVAALDKQIAGAEQELRALREQTDSAGLRIDVAERKGR